MSKRISWMTCTLYSSATKKTRYLQRTCKTCLWSSEGSGIAPLKFQMTSTTTSGARQESMMVKVESFTWDLEKPSKWWTTSGCFDWTGCTKRRGRVSLLTSVLHTSLSTNRTFPQWRRSWLRNEDKSCTTLHLTTRSISWLCSFIRTTSKVTCIGWRWSSEKSRRKKKESLPCIPRS